MQMDEFCYLTFLLFHQKKKFLNPRVHESDKEEPGWEYP